MGSSEFTRGRTIVARLAHGADLLDEIVTLAHHHGIESGALQGLGALQRARLAFYDQSGKSYKEFLLDGAARVHGALRQPLAARRARTRRTCT